LELLRFYAEAYLRLAKTLSDLETCLLIDEAEEEHGEPSGRRKETQHAAISDLETAKGLCEQIRLEVCCLHINELLLKAKTDCLRSSDVRGLQENIERELSCRFYVGISQDRKAAYCESLKGWEDITEVFSSATEDIEEMNKCFALCRYSATVFHSLMVTEHGLVKLGSLIGVTDPKLGWDASYRKLAEIVNNGRNANTTGLDFDFLEQVNGCVQAMKFAWRNKVNHATGKPVLMGGGFAPYVAEEIILATRGFMRRLAEGTR